MNNRVRMLARYKQSIFLELDGSSDFRKLFIYDFKILE